MKASTAGVEEDDGDLQDRIGLGPQSAGLEIDDREDRSVEIRVSGKTSRSPAEHSVTLGVGWTTDQTATNVRPERAGRGPAHRSVPPR